jgi:hypothetical protein
VARRGAALPLRWAVAHLEGDDFTAWQARGGATRRRAPVEVNCYSSRRLPAQRVAATRRHTTTPFSTGATSTVTATRLGG